jgi:hypothetical protein
MQPTLLWVCRHSEDNSYNILRVAPALRFTLSFEDLDGGCQHRGGIVCSRNVAVTAA